MRKLKVFQISRGGIICGAGKRILSLASQLQAEGIDPTLVFLFEGDCPQTARKEGYNVIVLDRKVGTRFSPWRKPFTLTRITIELAHLMREQKVDLVHTHTFHGNLCGGLAARLVGNPAVVTEIHALKLPHPHDVSWLRGLKFQQVVCISRLSHHIIAVSNELKIQLVQNNVPAYKIEVIRSGIDLDHFDSKRVAVSEVYQKWDLAPGTPMIGAVGRFSEVKNYQLLLEAAKLVILRLPETRVILIGDGPLREQLEKRARELGIAQNVLFTGWLDNVAPLVSILDVLVISSRTEASPLSLIEAMALGKPVVCSNVGGIPEIVTDGVNGLLVHSGSPMDFAEAIWFLLSHPSKAAEMGKKGRERVEKEFNLKVMAMKTTEVYQSVLEGKRRYQLSPA